MNQVVAPNLKNDPILRLLIQATMAGGRVVKSGQKRLVQGDVMKPDNSYVTTVDIASGEAAQSYLLRTRLGVIDEEKGFFGPNTAVKVLFDPVDGTRALLVGLSTSTVIAATYDEMTQQVTRCVVGEPATGRVWFAGTGDGAWVCYPGSNPSDTYTVEYSAASARRICVWDEVQLPGKPTYFLDVTASFLKPQQYERPITPHGLGRLLFEMVAVQGWDLSMPVSNGLNHALVANGGFGARAAVTTALGGPWDAAGVFLVQKAGGAVLGFKNGVRLESGLSVGRGDVFISANSPASAEELAQVVMTSFYPELYP